MGIFGRDERSPEDKPAVQQPANRPPPSGPRIPGGATVIAPGNNIEGTVRGPGDVRVEGSVKGAVDISGNLLVAEKGGVDGTISAASVIVAGRVKGDIAAAERIELQPSCKVEGNITAPRILINDGATFDGQVFMKDPGGGKLAAAAAPQAVTTSSARRKDGEPDEEKKPDEKS